ncbi:unnamed protein product [Prunus brigantina]
MPQPTQASPGFSNKIRPKPSTSSRREESPGQIRPRRPAFV